MTVAIIAMQLTRATPMVSSGGSRTLRTALGTLALQPLEDRLYISKSGGGDLWRALVGQHG